MSHNDENSFYDKKLKLNLATKEGKAKFLKHICALSNSNPKNNAYIVVGIEDKANSIVGVDFFDDSKLQNLINAYLENAPLVLYENIHFPHLPEGKVVGLVTIRPIDQITALKKNIWKYFGGAVSLEKEVFPCLRFLISNSKTPIAKKSKPLNNTPKIILA